MMQDPRVADRVFSFLREIDVVLLRPDIVDTSDQVLAATRESLGVVLRDFLAVQDIADDRISVIDGFLFIFNESRFAGWHLLNWWEQRTYIESIKDNGLYAGRANALLAQSHLAPYIGYTDDMVAQSTDLEVKRAWMRKRLVLKECFWNAIDSFSHAAYFKKKYQDQQTLPALCLLLCNVADTNGKNTEFVLGVDNGTGFQYKKKSRDSILISLLHKTYKFFFRSGAFYIGGLELGLLETDSELSCHGSGAVVYQGGW
jgi:hypothetical protein